VLQNSKNISKREAFNFAVDIDVCLAVSFLSAMAKKSAAAVELGRRGGKARAQKLTKQERSEIARKAAQSRWTKGKKR
jgi:hypothetical protein